MIGDINLLLNEKKNRIKISQFKSPRACEGSQTDLSMDRYDGSIGNLDSILQVNRIFFW